MNVSITCSLATSYRVRLAALAALTLAFSAHAEIRGTRPLVTILTQFAGPTDPDESRQWTNITSNEEVPIPPGPRGTLIRDVVVPAGGSPCTALEFKVENLVITHEFPADLIVSMSLLDSGGRLVHSQVVFNGPQLGAGKTIQQKAAITMPSEFKPDDLRMATTCNTFRLRIVNSGRISDGALMGWTLRTRTSWYSFAHNTDYYRRLLFGDDAPSVNGYYREVSRGKFLYTDAGQFTARLDNWRQDLATDQTHVAAAIHALEDQGFNFQQYDGDRDGVVWNSELTVIAVDNGSSVGGISRYGPELPDHCVSLRRSSLKYCGTIVLVPQQADFATIVHELAHTLGATDLYYGPSGVECRSWFLSLMSCTITTPDNPVSYYPDAWHRAKFGWVDLTLAASGVTELGSELWRDHYNRGSRPAILRNPDNPKEYYLFEYRTGDGYDNGLSGLGVVVWHIENDDNPNGGIALYAVSPPGPLSAVPYSVRYEGGVAKFLYLPFKEKGGSRAWTDADGPFRLKWADGSLLPYVFSIEWPNVPDMAILRMEDASRDDQPPVVEIVRPADGARGPYGLGNNVVFEARVSGAPDPRIVWVSDLDGVLGEGAQITYAFPKPGTRRVTVSARSRNGLAASRTITYTAERVAPSITILSPSANSTYVRGQAIRLAAVASTPALFLLPCSNMTWTADRVPSWSVTAVEQSGQCVATAELNVSGAVILTATTRDELGQYASASVSVTLTEPPRNSPPIVTIASPASGTVLYSYIAYRISGSVFDPQNAGPVQYRWTAYDTRSGREVQISTDASFDWRPDTFLTSGDVEIRLYGTNAQGVNSSASRAFRVLGPPR
jgi:M6 family metalloprotease-like protein